MSELLRELEAKPGKAKTSRLNGYRLPRGCQRYGVAVQEISPSFVMFSGTTGPLKSKVDHAARAACQGKGGHAVDLTEKCAGTKRESAQCVDGEGANGLV